MPTYLYKAKRNTSETVNGQMTANTQEEAVELINQLGLLPISVEAKAEEDINNLGHPQKVKLKDLYVFSRHLANLLRSGVPILKALDVISGQIQNRYFRKIIFKITWNVRNGASLSDALSDFPRIFSPLYITMVRAGEEGGNLQQMLVNISQYLRRQDEITTKVRTAMSYPVLMGMVGLGTIIFIMVFVLPKMMGLFTSLGDKLPLPTIILIKLSEILSKWWLWVLIGTLGVLGIIQRWAQSKSGQRALSQMVLSLPYIGELVLRVELSRFCRTVGLLMQSGVSIVKALSISIPLLTNETIKSQLTLCRDKLTAGGSFGETLIKSNRIPSLMGHLITIGEESGNLDDVLKELADSYEQETEEQIKMMTTLFEPIMILIVGLVIGSIVFAMLLPIFQVDVLVG